MISDPIADMLARIKNAYQARHKTVIIPHSKIKEKIGEILMKEGYIKKMAVVSADKKLAIAETQKKRKRGKSSASPKNSALTRFQGKHPKLMVTLKYPDGQPALTGFKRISKPGVRIYQKSKKIPPAPSLGMTLVSTPKGVMTGRLARKKKLGGEIICQIW